MPGNLVFSYIASITKIINNYFLNLQERKSDRYGKTVGTKRENKDEERKRNDAILHCPII